MKSMDANRYATKKTIAQGMLDIALLTANASQLKYILQVGHKHEFYTLMLILISVSIIMQVIFYPKPVSPYVEPFDFLFKQSLIDFEQFELSTFISCIFQLSFVSLARKSCLIDEFVMRLLSWSYIACNSSVHD